MTVIFRSHLRCVCVCGNKREQRRNRRQDGLTPTLCCRLSPSEETVFFLLRSHVQRVAPWTRHPSQSHPGGDGRYVSVIATAGSDIHAAAPTGSKPQLQIRSISVIPWLSNQKSACNGYKTATELRKHLEHTCNRCQIKTQPAWMSQICVDSPTWYRIWK